MKAQLNFLIFLIGTIGGTACAALPQINHYGGSVSITPNGNTALVGSFTDHEKGLNSGSAYVLSKAEDGSWSQTAKLTASDGAPEYHFGSSVSLSADGNIALIGAKDSDGKKGSAYVFTFKNGIWSQKDKLIASDGTVGDSFGSGVSLSADGRVALIGALFDDDNGTDSGSAYIFIFKDGIWSQAAKLVATTSDSSGSGWTQQAKMTASDSAAGGARFGNAVFLSADGRTALVGAEEDDNHNGSAYVFVGSNDRWKIQAKLMPTEARRCGRAVSLSNDGGTALIGCPNIDRSKGAAYVFTRAKDKAWTQQAKLTAENGTDNDMFGWSASLDEKGRIALIGAVNADRGADRGKGAAYVFTCAQDRNAWCRQTKLSAANASAGAWFGYSAALSSDGRTALIGAVYDEPTGGSVFMFSASQNNFKAISKQSKPMK